MKYKDLTNLPFFRVANEKDKHLLLLKEPPGEIVESTFNEVTGEEYKHIPIETLESMLDFFFSMRGHSFRYKFRISDDGLIVVKGELSVSGFGADFYSEFLGSAVRKLNPKAVMVKDYTGENIPVVLSVDEQMRTALPLTVTEAKKSAIKSIANVFGRNLNRGEQNMAGSMSISIKPHNPKMDPDAIIIQKYKVAEKQKDVNTLSELSQLYDFDSYVEKFKEENNSVTGTKKVKKSSNKREVSDVANK